VPVGPASCIKGGFEVNKNDLIASVADNSGLSKADAARAVDAVLESITGSLASGQDVRLVGFGTFSVANRAASEGRNPRTGEKIQIPASRQPKFKAGKALKDAVN
jgi:DNA-binding protein HU-beta